MLWTYFPTFVDLVPTPCKWTLFPSGRYFRGPFFRIPFIFIRRLDLAFSNTKQITIVNYPEAHNLRSYCTRARGQQSSFCTRDRVCSERPPFLVFSTIFDDKVDLQIHRNSFTCIGRCTPCRTYRPMPTKSVKYRSR